MTGIEGTAVPGFKSDPDSKPFDNIDGSVKPEPDLMDIPAADDDIYEDAGDLDFADASRGLCLTRVPKYLWDFWSKMDDDQEIKLGTIRVEGDISHPQRMSMVLSQDIARKAQLPAEYLLQLSRGQPANTFVFSEKDLPGYASSNKEGFRMSGGATAPVGARSTLLGPNSQGIDKNRRVHGRRGIPKQTALAGRIQKEVNCLPVDNADYKRIMDARAREAEKRVKPKTDYRPGLVAAAAGTAIVPGAGSGFNSFIKTKNRGRQAAQKMKAARIPQNELLDLIYDCFKRYEYWSFKNLKAQLLQPDAYLKETLEMVAHLVRSGSFANLWQLKPEAKAGAYEAYEQAKVEQAPDVGQDEGLDSDAEEDNDDEEMEDVLPQ